MNRLLTIVALAPALASVGVGADTKVNDSTSASLVGFERGPGSEYTVFLEDSALGWAIARLDQHGNRTWGPVRLRTTAGGPLTWSSFAWDGSGYGWAYAVTVSTSPGSEVWFHKIDAKGNNLTAPVKVSAGPVSDYACCPEVEFVEGEYVVGYVSRTVNGYGMAVAVRRIGAGGQLVSDELGIVDHNDGITNKIHVGRVQSTLAATWYRVEPTGERYIRGAWLDLTGNFVVPPKTYFQAKAGHSINAYTPNSLEDRVALFVKQRESGGGVADPMEMVHIGTDGMFLLGPVPVVEDLPDWGGGAFSTPHGFGMAWRHKASSDPAGQIYLRRFATMADLFSDSMRVSSIPSGAGPSGTAARYVDGVYGVAWNDNREVSSEFDVFFDVAPAYEVLAIGAGPSATATPQVDLLQPEDPTGPVVTSIAPYAAGGYGANVGAGEIDGQGAYNLLTGPGPGDVYGPQVRAFSWKGVPQPKVNYFAYGTLKFGVGAEGADLDGDGISEILTGAGPGEVFGPHVRGWNLDGVRLEPIQKVNFFAYQTLKYGVNAIGADIEADDFSEILTGPGSGDVFGTQLRGFNYDGAGLSSISKINAEIYAGQQYGLEVAGGDTDWDGFDELATGAGPSPAFGSEIATFDYDGSGLTSKGRFDAFTGSVGGARLSFCQWWDADINRELVVSRGPLAGNSSEVAAFDDSGATYAPLTTFEPYPGQDYGSTLTSVFVGF